MIIFSIDNRITDHFIKLKIRQVQFSPNSSNFNTINNTRYIQLVFLVAHNQLASQEASL